MSFWPFWFFFCHLSLLASTLFPAVPVCRVSPARCCISWPHQVECQSSHGIKTTLVVFFFPRLNPLSTNCVYFALLQSVLLSEPHSRHSPPSRRPLVLVRACEKPPLWSFNMIMTTIGCECFSRFFSFLVSVWAASSESDSVRRRGSAVRYTWTKLLNPQLKNRPPND